MSRDVRFDSIKDIKKRDREQVSPLSYNINEMKDIHRPRDKQNFRGRFPRDT